MGAIVVIVIILLIAYIVLSASINIFLGLIVPLIIWAIIGWLAGKLMRGHGYGAVGNILLGVGGGIIGSLVFRVLNLGVGDIWLVGNIIVGVVGAVIIVLIARAFGNRNLG
ncbi:MAG: GlsB/YeaQ/YmgE family stress response membrane protein [Anaerolineae bacterium]